MFLVNFLVYDITLHLYLNTFISQIFWANNFSKINAIFNISKTNWSLMVAFARLKQKEVKLFARCSLLVVRYFLLITRYFLLVTFCLLLVTFCSLLATFCSLLVTFYSLLVTFWLLLVTLLVARYFWLVALQEIVKDFFE